MADVVIVVGTRRGHEDVPAIEIKQMVGRAGRKHGGETALAHVVVEEDRLDEIRTGLEEGGNLDVYSPFGKIESVVVHLMPEISAGRVTDKASAERWFSRSLAAFQGRDVDFDKVFAAMERQGAVEVGFPEGVTPTKMGTIAADLYFHPGDIQAWRNNFTRLFELGLDNDTAAIAWALGTRHFGKSHGDFGDHRFVIAECKSMLPLGLDMEEGTVTQVVLWWCAMGGPSTGRMRNQMLELKDDIGRIKRALVRIDKEVANWGRVGFFDDVELMARKGIATHLVDLCKLPGITKGRADFLYNAGARDADGIVDVMGNIEDEIDGPFADALRGIVNDVRRSSH